MLLGREIGVVWHGPLVLWLFQLIARRKSNLLSKRVESISFSLRQRMRDRGHPILLRAWLGVGAPRAVPVALEVPLD